MTSPSIAGRVRDNETGIITEVTTEAELELMLGSGRYSEVTQTGKALDALNDSDNAPAEVAARKAAKKVDRDGSADDDGGADSGAKGPGRRPGRP